MAFDQGFRGPPSGDAVDPAGLVPGHTYRLKVRLRSAPARHKTRRLVYEGREGNGQLRFRLAVVDTAPSMVRARQFVWPGDIIGWEDMEPSEEVR